MVQSQQPGNAAARHGDFAGTMAGWDGLNVSLRWVVGLGAAMAGVPCLLIYFGILDAGAIAEAVARIDGTTLVLLLGLSLVNYACRVLKWHMFTRELTSSVRLVNSAGYFFTGFAFMFTPAKVGELVRLWLLKSRHGLPYARSLAMMVLDRAFDLGCLVGLAMLGVMASTDHAGALAVVIAGLAGLLALFSRRRLIIAATRGAHRCTGRRWPGFFIFALRVYRTVWGICRAPVVMGAVTLGVVAWGAQIAGMWLLLDALGFPVDPHFAAFVYTSAVLVALVPLFPGGVGGAEAMMTGLLVAAGMPAEAAVTAAVVNRLATAWFALALGLVVAPIVLGGGVQGGGMLGGGVSNEAQERFDMGRKRAR